MTRLLIICILSILASLSICFMMANCSHSNVITVGYKYRTCALNKASEFPEDVCLGFSAIKTCAKEIYSSCYGDDAVALFYSYLQIERAKQVREVILILRNSTEPQSLKAAENIESLFENCPEAPTKQETDKYTGKNLRFLDFVETDRKCSREDVEQVQYGVVTCTSNSTANFEGELKNGELRLKASGNLNDTSDETIVECRRNKFPTCFTERETNYMKAKLSRTYKGIQHVSSMFK